MSITREELLFMKLHDQLNLGGYTDILRVPGGWIYTRSYPNNIPTSVFVPYNTEEFQKDIKED